MSAGQKTGLSKFKNCSPQEEFPDKCKFYNRNCGGVCVYCHKDIPEDEEEELVVDKSVSSSRKH